MDLREAGLDLSITRLGLLPNPRQDRASADGEHDRQRRIAVAKISADRLPRARRIARDVEKIVDELKRHADRFSGVGELVDDRRPGAGDTRGDARSGLKETSGLPPDDLVVIGGRYRGVATQPSLHDLAL